jgi:fructose-1,6-bisphosphatase/inositol monophosphatase family enzyme
MNLPDAKSLKEMEGETIAMARGAGALLAERFGRGIRPEFKDKEKKRDPVTEADRASQEFLQKEIEARFPGHAILGEEKLTQEGENPEWVWVLDPLDGTTNFMRGFALYGVSVGVLHHGRPVAGAVFLAGGLNGRGHVFHAHVGGGAFVEGERISVAREGQPSPTHLVCLPGQYWTVFAMQSKLKRQPGEVRGSGCIVNDLGRGGGRSSRERGGRGGVGPKGEGDGVAPAGAFRPGLHVAPRLLARVEGVERGPHRREQGHRPFRRGEPSPSCPGTVEPEAQGRRVSSWKKDLMNRGVIEA